MTAAAKHIIKKQALEVHVPSRREHHAVSEQVSALFYREIVPQLSLLFDRLAPPGITFSIERLSIDLGVVPPKALERRLPELFLEAAEKALEQLLPTAFAVSNAATPNISARSQAQTLETACSIFLETGALPWWHSPESFEEFERDLLALPPERLLALIRAAVALPPARRRLTMQFSERFFAEILTFAVPGKRKLPIKQPDSPAQKEKLLVAVFLYGKLGKKRADPEEMNTWQSCDPERISEIVPKPCKPTRIKKSPEQKPPEPSPGQEYYIHNAGLVLLWPFLEPYFDALGLLHDGTFTDETARQRAVHLTEYLVSGRSDAKEYELILNKLLCGHPLEEPLVSHIKLSKQEKQESKQLLLDVIGHWTALGETTPAGLQESFLQRAGKLSIRNGGWRLQVEQKPYDMLLANLPWGIGMVKLGWMEGGVTVEWS